jgi:uncharacterized membrane protein YczE
MIINYLLIILNNTFKKEKELIRGFLSLFLFSIKKGFKLFIKKLPKFKEVFLKHISTYPGPLDPHVSVRC